MKSHEDIVINKLIDKNNIIENLTNNDSKCTIINKINNYFDNYLNRNNKIIIFELINQFIYFQNNCCQIPNNNKDLLSTEIVNNLNDLIKNFLIDRRNSIRILIKKNNYNFYNLNKFIKEFLIKIDYINDILKLKYLDDSHTLNNTLSGESLKINNITNFSIEYLSQFIISDSIILLFIENQIILFSKNNNKEIEIFFSLIKKICYYDNKKLYNYIIKILCNILNKEIIIQNSNPLPNNLKNINKLNTDIIYYDKIIKYFKYIKNDLIYNIIPNIFNNFINIFKFNSLYEIEYVTNNISSELKNIFANKYDNKDLLKNMLITEICFLIKKTFSFEIINNENSEQGSIDELNIMIITLINILNNTNLLLDNYLNMNNNLIINEMNQFINNDILLNAIYNRINLLIINNDINEIYKLLSFVIKIKDKDIIINKYKEFLTKRLLFNYSKFYPHFPELIDYITIEEKIFNSIKTKFHNKSIYKIGKMIDDIRNSIIHNIELKNYEIINDKFLDNINNICIVNLSYEIWNINYSDYIIGNKILNDYKNTSNILIQYILKYNNIYSSEYDNKRFLNWYLHYGEVDITYLNQNLIMLPIQYMVLEMFTNQNEISLDIIYSSYFFENYPTQFKKDIINSLIRSKLFNIKNNNLILATNGIFVQNLVMLFTHESEFMSNKKLEELALTHNDIVISNINHILKINSLAYDELFDVIKNKIIVFNMDKKIFETAINYMIDKDYIILNKNNLYEKIYY
jgi:hypothetical protein